MNQTRILIGVILLLLSAFGFMYWSQQNDMKIQQQQQKELLAQLLAGKNGTTAAAATAEPGRAGSNGEAANPSTNPAAKPPATQISPEQQRLEMLAKEVEAMKKENQSLKLQGEADAEEKSRLTGELDRAKFEIDQRIQRIRSSPMLAKVSKVIPDQGFVVISAGRSAGIEPNDEFSIRRGDKVICHIRIGQSMDDAEAVADPVPGTMAPEESIKEGDEVVKID